MVWAAAQRAAWPRGLKKNAVAQVLEEEDLQDAQISEQEQSAALRELLEYHFPHLIRSIFPPGEREEAPRPRSVSLAGPSGGEGYIDPFLFWDHM